MAEHGFFTTQQYKELLDKCNLKEGDSSEELFARLLKEQVPLDAAISTMATILPSHLHRLGLAPQISAIFEGRNIKSTGSCDQFCPLRARISAASFVANLFAQDENVIDYKEDGLCVAVKPYWDALIRVLTEQEKHPLALVLACISLCPTMLAACVNPNLKPFVNTILPVLLNLLDCDIMFSSSSAKKSDGLGDSIRCHSVAFAAKTQLGVCLGIEAADRYMAIITQALQAFEQRRAEKASSSSTNNENKMAVDDGELDSVGDLLKSATPASAAQWVAEEKQAEKVLAMEAQLVIESLMLTLHSLDLYRARRVLDLRQSLWGNNNAASTQSIPPVGSSGKRGLGSSAEPEAGGEEAERAFDDIAQSTALSQAPAAKKADPRRRQHLKGTDHVEEKTASPLLGTLRRLLESRVPEKMDAFWPVLGGLLARVALLASQDPSGEKEEEGFLLPSKHDPSHAPLIGLEVLNGTWWCENVTLSSTTPGTQCLLYERLLIPWLTWYSEHALDRLLLVALKLPHVTLGHLLQAHVSLQGMHVVAAARPALIMPYVQWLINQLTSSSVYGTTEGVRGDVGIALLKAWVAWKEPRAIIENAVQAHVTNDKALLATFCAVQPRLLGQVAKLFEAEPSAPDWDQFSRELPHEMASKITIGRARRFALVLKRGIFPLAFTAKFLAPCAEALMTKGDESIAAILAPAVKACVISRAFDVRRMAMLLVPHLLPEDLFSILPLIMMPRADSSQSDPEVSGEKLEEEHASKGFDKGDPFIADFMKKLVDCSKVSASELFFRLHTFPSSTEKVDDSALANAFETVANALKPDTLADALQRLANHSPLPRAFMRSVVHAHNLHPNLGAFIAGLLTRLVATSLPSIAFDDVRVWGNFISACRTLMPASITALSALPFTLQEKAMLEDASLRSAVKDFLYGQPPSVRRRFASLMDALSSSSNRP